MNKCRICGKEFTSDFSDDQCPNCYMKKCTSESRCDKCGVIIISDQTDSNTSLCAACLRKSSSRKKNIATAAISLLGIAGAVFVKYKED